MSGRWQKIILISTFTLALGLRLILCFTNRWANDDHIEVISWIVDKHEMPLAGDCWECHQPKAFYLLNAGIIKMFSIQNRINRIISVQIVNFIFSCLILLFMWKFIRRLNIAPVSGLFAFALTAFNPCLAGINVQATNDTLSILLGVLTIYYTISFFEELTYRNALLLILFAVLSAITKGTGLVILVALAFIFIIKIVFSISTQRKPIAKVFAIFLLSTIAIVPFAGGYFQNYQKFDSPFYAGLEGNSEPLLLARETFVHRPGVTSILNSYFTFRIFDLVREPYITNGTSIATANRTSLWSQLYGRTVFLHFDQHPGRWASLRPKIINVGRALIILGLIPLSLFLVGYIKTGAEWFKNFYRRNAAYFQNSNQWMHFIFVSAYFIFIIKFTAEFRDFCTMKSIYLFPALPAFAALFLDGFSQVKSKWIRRTVFFSIALIAGLSLYDIWYLINQLW